MGALANAALRQEIREAQAKALSGERPRDVFERIIVEEARELLEREKRA